MIENSTITNNTAAADEGSGVASFGDNIARTEVGASIIAGNGNTDVDFVIGTGTNTFVSNGFNVIGDGNATGAFTGTGDQTGVANPALGSLANNGGPTRTHALLTGSPAIDKVTTGCPPPATDQRGVTRPMGPLCDSGSFEAAPAAVPMADLSVTKADSPDPVTVGQTLTYTVTVTNDGPDPATGVTLVDTLPGGVTLVSATPSQGSPCSGTSTVSCSLGNVAMSGSASVTLTVTPNAPGALSNQADVTANESDPDTLDNTVTANTTVNAIPALTCNGLTPTKVGTEGNDVLRGTNGNDVIVGLGGNDLIRGLRGNDLLCGGDGNDELRGGKQNDRLFGENGNDLLKGDNDRDRLDGGADTDRCEGGPARDTAVNCEQAPVFREEGAWR